jgi:hypothetical protein
MHIETTTANDAAEEVRKRQLQRLLPLWPHEIADTSLAGQRRICQLLARAIRRERQRGVAGHWTYDISRHAALARVLNPELKRLARLQRDAKMPARPAGIWSDLASGVTGGPER